MLLCDFVDDYSRFTWIYLMRDRYKLPSIYLKFANMITTQFSSKIKILRTDNVMEYKESSFTQFLSHNRTIVQRSFLGTSPQNRHTERKHRYILDTVRAFLISSFCPESFWGEDALTTVYIINRIPSPIIGNVSPFEHLHNHPSNYHLLKVFGSACFVLLKPHEYKKLELRA